eukprot:jgi/Bigna1/76699/fgenesh1_pg.43_\
MTQLSFLSKAKVHLSRSGNNFNHCAFTMKAVFAAENTIDCFEMAKPSTMVNRPAKPIDVIKNPEHCREVARISETEAEVWRANVPTTNTDDEADVRAHAAMCLTVHSAHQHSLDNSGGLAAVAWARLTERFKPTDDAPVHELSSGLQQASIENFDHDAEAHCSKLVAICGRLHSANQAVSEQPKRKCKAIVHGLAAANHKQPKTCTEQLRDLLSAKRMATNRDGQEKNHVQAEVKRTCVKKRPAQETMNCQGNQCHHGDGDDNHRRGRGRGSRGSRGGGGRGRRGRGRGGRKRHHNNNKKHLLLVHIKWAQSLLLNCNGPSLRCVQLVLTHDELLQRHVQLLWLTHVPPVNHGF